MNTEELSIDSRESRNQGVRSLQVQRSGSVVLHVSEVLLGFLTNLLYEC